MPGDFDPTNHSLYWKGLNEVNLVELHSFSFQYQRYSSVYQCLTELSASVRFVFNAAVKMENASLNWMIAQNPPLCVNFISTKKILSNLPERTLKAKEYFETPFFIQLQETGNLGINMGASFAILVKIPRTITYKFDSAIESGRFSLAMEGSQQIAAMYMDIDDFRASFTDDAICLSKLFKLAQELAEVDSALENASIQWKIVNISSRILINMPENICLTLSIEKHGGDFIWAISGLNELAPCEEYIKQCLEDERTGILKLLMVFEISNP